MSQSRGTKDKTKAITQQEQPTARSVTMIEVYYQLRVNEVIIGDVGRVEIEHDANIAHLKDAILKKHTLLLRDYDDTNIRVHHQLALLRPQDEIPTQTLQHPLAVDVRDHPPVAAVPPVAGDSSIPAAATRADNDLIKMRSFFKETDMKKIEFSNDSYCVENCPILGWTQKRLDRFLWRSCYSYIICTIIGAFESAHVNPQDNRRHISLVLTGVQGTGKTILGAFVALVMGQLGWKVFYVWSDKSVVFGNESEVEKVIEIIDYSFGTGNGRPSSSLSKLIISSCSRERWADVAQQETWDVTKGNYIFIDPITKGEMSIMPSDNSNETIKQNFSLVGGVARLCLEATTDTLRSLVDSAIFTYKMKLNTSIQALTEMNDQPSEPSDKIYPGLIAHFVPTNPCRNEFRLRISSPYVKQEISRLTKEMNNNEIEHLMNSLLKIPKARGFAGNIWEPLFTKKAAGSDFKLVIAGTKLPANADATSIILNIHTNKLKHFEFDNSTDFMVKFKSTMMSAWSTTSRTIIAKATKDNFAAIDGVLVQVTATSLIVAGMQMTVAGENHDLEEVGMDNFVDLSHAIKSYLEDLGRSITTASTQVWFLQPEKCLDANFRLIYRQPVKFKKAEAVSTSELESRKRKKSSNNPSLWSDKLQNVDQYVAIAKFVGSPGGDETPINGTSRQDEIADSFREKLNVMANEVVETDEKPIVEPTLRPWSSTLTGFKRLKLLSDDGKFPTNLVLSIGFDLDTEFGATYPNFMDEVYSVEKQVDGRSTL